MPHGWLVFGICLIFLGVVYTCMGESYERFYGWIYRSKEPKWPMCLTYREIFCLVFCSLGASYTSYIC
jgi:hypothetical protein